MSRDQGGGVGDRRGRGGIRCRVWSVGGRF